MNSDFDISFEYNKTYISNKKIFLDFDITILNYTDEKIEKNKIKKILEKQNNEYIKLISFSNKKVKYEFLISKWVKESCSNNIQDTFDRYEKRIKLNKLPSIISMYVEPLQTIKYVEGEFRNYIEKNGKLKNKLKECIKTNIKNLSPAYFKFSYDSYLNFISVSLKPEFRINPMLFLDKETKEVKKVNFDKSVYSLLGIK